MSEITIRPESDEADRVFIRGLNVRLSGVIDAPTHSEEEIVAFQDRFTASAWENGTGDSATFVAVGKNGRDFSPGAVDPLRPYITIKPK